MAKPFDQNNGLHSDRALSVALERKDGIWYFSVIPIRPTTPTITTVTTANANWTALATGLTDVLTWRISELNGDNVHYAYVVAPGNNFSVAFGWVSMHTSPTNIYIKRPAGDNITVKLETWSS